MKPVSSPSVRPVDPPASSIRQAARRRVVGWLATAAASALVAGCAGPARIGGESPAFERTGRFAVNVDDVAGAPEAVQGGFAWRDTGRRLQIDLVNPLGSTLARVTVDHGGALLEQADGRTERAADADALLAKVMGTALPVSNLRDWLRGRPGDGETLAMQRDADGRLQSFSQGGWQLRMSRHDALGPGLLRLERRDGTRRISVRLAMDTNPSQ